MNIKEAKEQIANAVKAYLTKNEFGEYIIPIERQRPVFMIGAPGIGKTAIMEQIAQELNVGLVSYSSHPAKRPGAAFYCAGGIRRPSVCGVGIYDERNCGRRLQAAKGNRPAGGHFVFGRD